MALSPEKFEFQPQHYRYYFAIYKKINKPYLFQPLNFSYHNGSMPRMPSLLIYKKNILIHVVNVYLLTWFNYNCQLISEHPQ